MNVKFVRSDGIYTKILKAPFDRKDDSYRYELMMPFEKKWACYSVPMKAATPNGVDVIMASGMLGHIAPTKVDETQRDNIQRISSAMNEGYCGDGGIPGYIFSWLIPNDYTLEHLPVALAHETNHNVRFQFIKWRNDITLGEMMVSEGLAENFATYLYGEDKAGPWVKKTDMETLNEYIKPIIYDGLDVQGLEKLNAYLYGDEMAALQNYPPVGLPYCAGYACGYHLVKYYLQKTGKSIVEATLLPASEILSEVEDFWNE